MQGISPRLQEQSPRTYSRAEQVFDTQILAPGEASRLSAELLAFLVSKGIRFSEGLLPTSIKPHFVQLDVHEAWAAAAHKTFAALTAVAQIVLESPSLLERLGFDAYAQDLLKIDPGFSGTAITCRPDGLWDGSQMRFVEFNADSPAMAMFTDLIQEALMQQAPMKAVAAEIEVGAPSRMSAFMAAIVRSYREAGGDKDDPTIAIVDWPGVTTRYEHRHIAEFFSAHGLTSLVCSPDELSWRDRRIHVGDREIDIVQRRILFPEVLKRSAELTVLLRAYREQAVVMVNPLRSYIMGSKGLLALAQERPILDLLEVEHRRAIADHLPETIFLDDPATLQQIEQGKDAWMLKASFGYGGSQVISGAASSAEAWRAACVAAREGHWIAQRALPTPSYCLPIVEHETCSMQPRYICWNPWIFDGKFAGATSRCSSSQIVSITQKGALLPSFSVAS